MKPVFLAGPDDGKLDYYERAGRRSGRDEIVLEEDFIFRDSRGLIWIAPINLCYDGASIPKLFWSITGHPFESRHILAGATHDQGYQTGERLTIDPAALTGVDPLRIPPLELCAMPRVSLPADRYEVDYFAIYEPLLATPGNSRLHARIVFSAVRAGGWSPWNAHVRRRVAERKPFSLLHAG